MNEPERTFDARPDDREARFARALMAVSALMVETEDIEVVIGVLLAECVRLLDLVGAALVLTDAHGPTPVRATGPASTVLADLEQSTRTGPSVAVLVDGAEVDITTEEARGRWPAWSTSAESLGVGRVVSLPVRLDGRPVGALELLRRGGGSLDAVMIQVARTFAGLAAVVVQRADELRRSSTQVQQLEAALRTRVVVEQAKGFLVAHGFETPEEAFEALRAHARRNHLKVHVVAEAVLTARLDVRALRR